MKQWVLLTLLLLPVHKLLAQGITSGGYGYFLTGPSWVLTSEINDYLKKPAVLGPSYTPFPMGIQAGGEGYGMINRFIIGGGGLGNQFFTVTADSGSAKLSLGGGYFKTGYCFYSRPSTFMTLAIGFGGFGYSMEIKNIRSQTGIAFNEVFPVRIGEEREYGFGGTLFDVTYGLKKMIGQFENRPISGFMIGLDAGCMIHIPTGDWSGDEESIIGPPEPGVIPVPYLRLTIGGGGFVASGQ